MRCEHVGIACGNPPAPLDLTAAGGPFDDCVPLTQAAGSQLYDVERYIDFFARPGGVKANPSDVILAAIASPPSPFAWTDPSTCAVASPCPNLVASCASAANPAFFGDPTVRLSAVVNAGLTARLDSICDPDYSGALDGLARQIMARLR